MTEMILDTKTLPDQIASFFATRQVRVHGRENELMLTPVIDASDSHSKPKRQRAKVSLEARFKDYTGDYQPSEYDWGEPVGKEVW